MSSNFFKSKYLAVAFLSGFAIMVIEITAARILAPSIGVSLYSWTSIIGIMLLGIAAGSVIGGKIIDFYPDDKILARALVISGILTAIIPIISKKLAPTIILWGLPFAAKVIMISAITLLPSSLILGTIYPMGIKLFIKNLTTIGKESGTFYAVSTIGAILGTFSAGFYFIGALGSSNTIYLMAFILILLPAAIYFEKKDLFLIMAAFIIFKADANVSNQNQNIIFASESPYHAIKIAEDENANRYLILDRDIHGVENKNSESGAEYIQAFQITGLFSENPKNILMIGGGAYSAPKQFAKIFPKSEIDVIEIDPKITEAAENFFNLKNFKINTVSSDARIYLKNSKKYDIIIGDAYNELMSIPWHLTTIEFTKEIRGKLNEKGIYAVNLASALNGKNSKLFQSYYKTFKQIFPNSFILPMGNNINKIQNIIIAGVNQTDISMDKIIENAKKSDSDKELIAFLDNIYNPKKIDEKIPILTDEKAPIENLMLPIINDYTQSAQWTVQLIK